jgi:hypothetical protein
VPWTPTVLVLDADGRERARVEGYLPRREFEAALLNGLGRVAFMHKRWEEAEARYGSVAERYGDTDAAAEAVYWRGVAEYKRTQDHTALGRVAERLAASHAGSVWATKASVWGA